MADRGAEKATKNRTKSARLISRPVFWLSTVCLVAFLVRLTTILVYQPVEYNDTPNYYRLAGWVKDGFVGYDGTRTPGYPAFLALVGNEHNVWIVQLILGFITTLLLFYIGWKLTGKPWFGGVIALAHTLNLGQLFFESNLITETLTTFLIVLAMAGVLVWLLYPNRRNVWLAFGLGLTSTFALLVRPLFIYLPVLILVTLLIKPWAGKTFHRSVENDDEAKPVKVSYHPWRTAVAFLVPVVLLLGGWMSFIHSQFGQWDISTLSGYQLLQHTGNFFEYVPDKYASLRDTYIKYRDAHIAETGTQTDAIWAAIPEMSKVSGYSFYTLSNVLMEINIQLILHHPFLFVKSALSGWALFWKTSVYWSPEALKLPGLASGIGVAILIERVILFLTNLFFIASSLYIIGMAGINRIRHKPVKPFIQFDNEGTRIYFWMLAANIWVVSILQTLLDHGDNMRFLIPLQSLVVLWVAVLVMRWIQHKRSSLEFTPDPITTKSTTQP